jgi:Domain of Unknown Function (DUF928)
MKLKVVNYNFFGKNLITLSLAIVLGSVIVSEPLAAIAQHYVPPRRGIPGRREGAGTRAPQTHNSQTTPLQTLRLMPLIPEDQFGVTISNTPTFFWYVPNTSAKTSQFRLVNTLDDQEVLVETIPLTGKAGVMSYQLPAPITELLTLGKEYKWQVSLVYDSENPAANPFVEGVVQRVEPNLALTEAITKTRDVRGLAILYAQQGLWYEALQILAEHRCDRPDDFASKVGWASLLKSVRLGEFAQAPLTDACTPFKTTNQTTNQTSQ